ncbi:hypothetical protein [Streptomyces sp. NBC_00996]|uniref:hypothetical protein n=1 Tax=Streptomyces sp. NBC_00996 TaxID=2903710 RepID=UPI003869CD89|nr:hypothetical protein OG390_45540 [Streptomyces sp. NBC_00996]
MASHVYVHVPEDLWPLLEEGDFDEVETSTRGMEQWSSVVEAVLSVGGTALNVSTQLVAVYVAREQIGDFVNRVAAWLGLAARNASVPSVPLTLTVTTTIGEAGRSIEVVCPFGPDGTPVVDTAVLTDAITSALDSQSSAAG